MTYDQLQNEPILITGCARSGTSWRARIINTAGAFGGKMAGPNRANQKGMFENTEIRNTIVKPFFASIGADRLGQKPLPDRNICKIVAETKAEEWRKQVMSVFYEQGYTDGAFFYKGAKMCLTWAVWHAAFPNAKWIIVRRDDEGIINSCMRTGFMRAYRNRADWQGWIDEHKKCFAEMEAAGLDVCEVNTDELAAGNLEGITNCLAHCGLSVTLDDNLIDPSLFQVKQGVEHAK